MILVLRSHISLARGDLISLWSRGSGLSHFWLLLELLLLTCGLFPQDNYTFAQPGIQKKVKALEELVSRIDGR